MPAAHIAGVPIEETLLSFGGPAAIYIAAIGFVTALRRMRARASSFARRHPGVRG